MLTSEQLAVYRQTAKHNWQKSHPQRKQRRQKAWKLARLAATLLKEQFGATKVMVFGSLVREDCFTLWSDVDIAAWGILPQDTFKAMEAVRDLDDTIEVNLVDVAACKRELLNNILQEGIVL
jgi:predicted nucleotidyltransferase